MTPADRIAVLSLFPITATVKGDRLYIGGCDVVELAERFDTPLYLFDELTLRGQCREFRSQFEGRYPNTLIIYAAKAFLNRALAQLFKEEGLGLDVVSGGELAIARSVDFPRERVYFHGNNKTEPELAEALDWGIGRIVVDNLQELGLLERLAADRGIRQDILLRLSPGIDPHTHRFTTTGVIDSKFGFPIPTGQAEQAVARALASAHLNLIGLHCHLGSPIFELEPFAQAVDIMLEFASQMAQRHGLRLQEFSPGGGFAIQYTLDKPAPSIAQYAEVITSKLGPQVGKLVVEPGRSVVGRAGVALYRVGAIKDIPGVRRYVSVDGGMADNIRPALYGARYQALLANKAAAQGGAPVTVAGKFCESGDILIQDIELPEPCAGDIIAIPCSGAYCPAMASNYNAALKPAIIFVKEGQARLVRRRQSYDDLMAQDLV
ncbi:MAG TPA: diaminopimelate decarboxylase [Dehalococcoidia bacterium]|nr:diaminopimelate decarboxylase [Dehalococcoidia bacterium]